MQVLEESRRGYHISRTGVKDSLFNVGAGNWTPTFQKNHKHSEPLTHLCSPGQRFLTSSEWQAASENLKETYRLVQKSSQLPIRGPFIL